MKDFLYIQTEHELGLLKMSLLFNFGAQEAEKLKGKSIACFVGHPVHVHVHVIWSLETRVMFMQRNSATPQFSIQMYGA